MHDTLLAIFTGILAFAVLMQSILFFLMYKSIHQLTMKIDGLGKDLLRHVGKITSNVEEAVASIQGVVDVIKPVAQKLAESAEIVHDRVLDIDSFLGDVSNTARQEIVRIQDTFQDAAQRAQDAIGTLRDSLMAPIGQLNAITRAIRVALDVFFRSKKNTSRPLTQDD